MTEKELKQLIKDIRSFSKKLDTPEKAREFLMSAGIVDKDGNLTEPYRPTGNEEDEISYRYPSGRKNINRSVYEKP
ncbi:MAG: hypothetical protein LBJ01_08375 [Tannerella sp.]|jgi:hypothetical protein|nr:hypothetical protein [Tannerella sp.]